MQSLKTTLAFRLVSEVLAAITAMLLCSSPASGQHKPKIRAVFETDAPLLTISPGLDLPSTKRQLSKTLAELGNQYLGFLNWSPTREDPSGSPPTEILTARLVEKPVNSKPDEFILRIEGPPGKTIHEDKLYGPWQVIAKDREQLVKFIQDRLEEWFNNSDIKEKIVARYLRYIPIGNKAEALGEDRIGVFLPYREILANDKSIMTVDLLSTLRGYSGGATLSLNVRRDHAKIGEWYDKIQCSVDNFSFNTFHLYRGWHADIQSILKNQEAGSLSVYMYHYERCESKTDCSVVWIP